MTAAPACVVDVTFSAGAVACSFWAKECYDDYRLDGVRQGSGHARCGTVGYLSFGPIEKYCVFCDLSVREKALRSRKRGAQAA